MAQMYRILGKRGRITIPYEIRQRVGFSQNDVLSFTESPDGRTVLVKREKLCDDNCKPERAQQRKEETDSVTLFDFLNSLSDEQQCAALYIVPNFFIDAEIGNIIGTKETVQGDSAQDFNAALGDAIRNMDEAQSIKNWQEQLIALQSSMLPSYPLK